MAESGPPPARPPRRDYAELEGKVSADALQKAGIARVDTSKRFAGPRDSSGAQ